jgi:thiol-disulfide isomerase/thioredoxin
MARDVRAQKRGLEPGARPSASMGDEGPMPSLDGAVQWLNSEPLATRQLRGRVVLIDFWTYSCINWQRTLPYVRAWADKYKSQGLVVVGVHTPEFGFERNLDQVRRASELLDVRFPVAVDSDQAIWRAFGNQYWPAVYIVDSRGRVRHHRFGEGDYGGIERVVQQLLIEAGAEGVDGGLVHVEGTGSQAEADWANLQSPETYVGYARAENFASRGGMAPGTARVYSVPARLALNAWTLAGEWLVEPEAAMLARPHGRIAFRFHARDLHLVMGPAANRKPMHFRIGIDGQPPGTAHGTDVDADGNGLLVEPRLYQLIRQRTPVVDRRFEIEFPEPGVQAYSFTFG